MCQERDALGPFGSGGLSMRSGRPGRPCRRLTDRPSLAHEPRAGGKVREGGGLAMRGGLDLGEKDRAGASASEALVGEELGGMVRSVGSGIPCRPHQPFAVKGLPSPSFGVPSEMRAQPGSQGHYRQCEGPGSS